jgi:hypothetical protein
MVLLTLGSREHRVVVGHHDALRARVFEQVAVDFSDAREHPVGGRVLDQVLDGSAPALGRDNDGAIFDESSGVAQVGDVLASGALVGLAPAPTASGRD